MDRFFLEEPSQARKKEALEYLKEHIEYNSDINGVGGMDKCLNKTTYEDWLIEIQKRKDKEYAYSINRVPQQTFFLISSVILTIIFICQRIGTSFSF